MTNISEQKANSDRMNSSTAAKLALRKDIRKKWDKFSELDADALQSREDLVGQLVAKYSFEPARALADAKAMINGRSF